MTPKERTTKDLGRLPKDRGKYVGAIPGLNSLPPAGGSAEAFSSLGSLHGIRCMLC